jgi:two-component system LytT family response regulator
VFVDSGDIDRVEAAGNYVRVHAGAVQHLVRDTLKGILERLDPQRFLRVHNSHVVNIERVRELHPWSHGEYVVVLADGTRIASSRTYSPRLRSLIQP